MIPGKAGDISNKRIKEQKRCSGEAEKEAAERKLIKDFAEYKDSEKYGKKISNTRYNSCG